MWAMLATLTSYANEIPPFQLTAMTLGIGGLLGLASWPFRPGAARALLAPKRAWALGLFGLFGYHFSYFIALRHAPAVEASLIAYLWPLFIVVMASFLPGEYLKTRHLLGAVFGLIGAGLLVSGGTGLALRSEFALGYGAALICALVWSSYSVLSRLLGEVSSDSIAGFCLASALIAALAHFAFETSVWPSQPASYLAILLLGLFPTGLAFYVWDIGVKKGDIQVLGVLSYLTPIASTLLLIVFGRAEFTWTMAVALALVTLGAWVATRKTAEG